MRRMLRVWVSVAALAVAGWAQAKPNFSGVWKLDPLRSRLDAIAAPKNLVLQIDHQDPKLRVVVTETSHHGAETTETLDLTTDGTQHQETIAGQAGTASAQWDGDHLVLEAEESTAEGLVTLSRRMRLGDKGRIITTVLTITDKAGQKKAYEFFVKQ